MIEWLPEDPPHSSWLSLGSVGDAPPPDSGFQGKVTKDLTSFEKIMLAGLALNVAVFGWQVYQWREEHSKK